MPVDTKKIQEQWKAHQAAINEAVNTHSWRYGQYDVTCIMCGCSRATQKGIEPCRFLK